MVKIKEEKLKSGKTVFRAIAYAGINPATGKKKYKTISGDTYKSVEKKIKRLAVDRLDGKIAKNDDITFYQAYKEWFATYKTTVKPSTVESVESKMKAVLPYLKNLKLKKITHNTCQKMVTSLIEKGDRSRETIMNYRRYCSQVFYYCEKQGYIAKNPMRFVKVPRNANDFLYSKSDQLNVKRKYWTKDEVKRFLDLALKELKYHDYVMFRVLLFSGMRKGELQALHWDDIDLDTGEIQILKTLTTIGGKNFLQKPKTEKSIRSIMIDQKTISDLKKWKAMQREEYLALGRTSEWNDNPPIFADAWGTYFPLSHLNNVMDYNFYLHHPDFYKITIHQMRHTHASLLFESGSSIKDVQEKLGHAEIQTTMNIYTHVTSTKSKKSLDDFADFMEN